MSEFTTSGEGHVEGMEVVAAVPGAERALAEWLDEGQRLLDRWSTACRDEHDRLRNRAEIAEREGEKLREEVRALQQDNEELRHEVARLRRAQTEVAEVFGAAVTNMARMLEPVNEVLQRLKGETAAAAV